MTTPSERVRPSDMPLPETAFRDDAPLSASSQAAPTPVALDARYEVRSIGPSRPSAPIWRGTPVDLDLRSADVHDVFRLLAEVGKVNVVVAGDVSGTVTMRLRRVPWDQAMDVIARARGLVYERDGNVILVRSASGPR